MQPSPLDWHLNERLVQAHGFYPVAALLGRIPSFIFEADIRPAWEQIDERYIGGWQAMVPGKWQLDMNHYLLYPGDPPMEPIAFAFLRNEAIFVYRNAWVCITQNDGSFSIARLD